MMHTIKNRVNQTTVKGEPCNYRDDFKVLSDSEKSGILEVAKNLLNTQQRTAYLAEFSHLCNDGGKQGVA